MVKAERVRAGLTERQFQAAIGTHYCGTTLYKTCPSRERLMRCAEVLGSETLREIASSDLYWDRIVSIEPLGPQPVYDATVKGTHNFIADGLVSHNSIEQDADVVILLHREDAYERESPRAGEADLIVAKHRNGPTATVTVAFQGHYSRFVDMAPDKVVRLRAHHRSACARQFFSSRRIARAPRRDRSTTGPQADPLEEAGHDGRWPVVSPALIAASTTRA